MKRGVAPTMAPEARARAQQRARRIGTILLWGAMLVMLAPLYAWLAINYSGHLALAQTASADQTVRGFDFGPVYMRQGQPGRFYISAMLPQVDGGVWQTHFEVLDAQKLPVFRQDEMRFIGDYMFHAGNSDRFQKTFTLDRATGYYYFRFAADNGVYHTSAGDPPVVSFAVRQGVLDGWALWGPSIGAFIAGLLLLGLGFAAIRRLGSQPFPRERKTAPAPAPGDESPLAQRLRRRHIPPPGLQPQ
jgi:hypothetical protein